MGKHDRAMASVIALTPSGELLNLPLERALGSVERSADVAAYRNAFDAQTILFTSNPDLAAAVERAGAARIDLLTGVPA